MSIQSKKMSMADKMYHENSTGGVGASPKFKMKGEGKGKLAMKYTENGKGTTKGGGQGIQQANSKGSFVGKYDQADKSGSFKVKYNQ